MDILTNPQTTPPKFIQTTGGLQSVKTLIALDDWATLAEHGIYRHTNEPGQKGHAGYSAWVLASDAEGPLYTRYPIADVTAEGPAPLGYTDWELRQDAEGRDYYYREPVGTQEERDAAALQQSREAMILSRLQARLLLLQTPDPSGTFGSAWEAVMAWATTQDATTQAFWEDAPHWERLDPRVIAGAVAFGWDESTLDVLFEAGKTL
jgi:hypothetical protein